MLRTLAVPFAVLLAAPALAYTPSADGGATATPTTAGIIKARPTPIQIIGSGTTAVAFSNLPGLIGDWSVAFRVQAFLSGFTEFQLTCRQQAAGAAGADVCAAFTSDVTGASGWTHMDGTALTAGSAPDACDTVPGHLVLAATTNLTPAEGWLTLPEAARGDVVVTLYGSGGDGIVDPSFNNCILWVR